MPDAIDMKTKEERLYKLNELINSYSNAANKAYLDKVVPVLIEGVSEKDIEHQIGSLNNIPLIKSYLKRCAVKNATQLIKEGDNKQLIFGGKKNFIQRCKCKITKDEFLYKRLSKLYFIGSISVISIA